MQSPTKFVGTRGELRVADDLMRQGFSVYASVCDSSRIDLIAEKDGILLRIQVKTASNTSAGCVGVAPHKVVSRKQRLYGRNDFDIMAIHALDRNRTAYVPMARLFDEKGTHRSIHLRFDTPRNGQKKRVSFFAEYEICSSSSVG